MNEERPWMDTKTTSTLGPSPVPEAHLWARNGKNVGRRYSVGKPEQVIGRSAAADIEVDDDRVSSQHARIVALEGRHHILDLGSTNGTFVNDQRVDEAELRDGDLVQIGETIFEYLSYEERNLTITLRGGSSDSVVPPSLRSGAQQMLERERHTATESAAIPLPGPRPPGASNGANGAGASNGYPPQSNALVPMGQMQIPPIYPQAYYPPPYPSEPAEKEVTIKDAVDRAKTISAFFAPYWRSIVLCLAVGVAIGVVRHLTSPPPVKAVFQMSLDAKPTESNPTTTRYQRVSLEFFRAAEQTFKSPPVIQKTLTQLGFKDVSSGVLSRFQRRLVFDRIPPNPNLIYMAQPTSTPYEGSFTDDNAEFAVKFLETHVRIYLETEIEKTLRTMKQDVDFLTKQVQDAEKAVNTSEYDLLEFQKKNPGASPELARQYQAHLFELERERSALARIRTGAAVSATLEEQSLKGESELITTRRGQRTPYKLQIEQKSQQLAEAKAQDKGDDHPDVVRLKHEIKELEELAARNDSPANTEDEKTTNPLWQDTKRLMREGRVTAASAASRIKLLDREIEKLRVIVERLPKLEYEQTQLTRAHEAAKTALTQLQKKLKGAKVQLELERNAGAQRYDIITPVMVEEASTSKHLMKQVGMSGGIMFALGLAQAAGRRIRSTRRTRETKDLDPTTA